jgi:endonuclease G
MKPSLEERLRKAVSEVERSDSTLAEELRDVRSNRGAAAEAALGLQLESLGPEWADGERGLVRETIVLRTGRPVLAVVNDEAKLDFSETESEIWRQRLTAARDQLGAAIRAVGRVEVENHDLDWLGTGWIVQADPDIVVTNRHVAREFAGQRGEGFVFRQGFGGLMSARIDFLEEIGRADAREFRVTKILHVAADDGPDVAFLQVEQTAGVTLASPIRLAGRTATRDQQVAVIGYPARDSRIPEQDLMLQIFGNVFDKKRLAPGQVKHLSGGLLLHDCSTLGGNSGSVVLDLDSGDAVALHFSGRFLEANFAVPARTVAEELGAIGRPRVRPRTPRLETSRPLHTSTSTVAITIPLRIRVEVGMPEVDGPGPQRSTDSDGPSAVASPPDDAGGDEIEEGRPEDYANRRGYVEDFLGTTLALPDIHDDGDVLTFRVDGVKERELRYEHFSVVMSRSRRLCRYSAVNIDGRRRGSAQRTAWRIDPRIARHEQTVDGCYGNPPRFARGHMTRREDPIWGMTASAARGNSDSMHLTNAVPQMQPFNAGIWLRLEDYALKHAREDDMRLSVVTGPVLRDDDPVMFGVQIPVIFWKVIAFIHDETREPCATGYTMSQRDFLRAEEFVFGRHQTSQVPLAVIERMAGLSFTGDLRRLDPLERVAEAQPIALRNFEEIRFH